MNRDMVVFRKVVERVSGHNLWCQDTGGQYKKFTLLVEALFVYGETFVMMALLVIPGNINSEVYLNQVINNIVPEFRVGPGFLFLVDNVRPHRSMAVMNVIETNVIPHLALPALSPDLNPIELAWDQLQRALDHHNPQWNN